MLPSSVLTYPCMLPTSVFTYPCMLPTSVCTYPCMLPSTVCKRVSACFPLQCVYLSLHASLYRAFTCSCSLYIVFTFFCCPMGCVVCIPASLCIMCVCSCFPVHFVCVFLLPCIYCTEQCVYVFLLRCTVLRFYTLTVCTCLYSIIHTTLD